MITSPCRISNFAVNTYKQHALNFKLSTQSLVQIQVLIPKSAAERPKYLNIWHYMVFFCSLIDIYLLN